MSGYKKQLGFDKLEKALIALETMAVAPMQDNRGNIDATIQRFEFTIELFWKLLQHVLEDKGTLVQYPKDVLRAAFKGGLISEELLWLRMLQDRNLTSHTYDEGLADAIYGRIRLYVPFLRESLENMRKVL